MNLRSGLYTGEVVHKRFHPKAHMLRYRVFALLLDLDELPHLGKHVRFFGYNRTAPISFHDRDHGEGGSLRAWAEARMRAIGLEPDGGPIEVLCYPRIFGFVFNPLSVFFCRLRTGELAAILYEVHNMHGERHTYALPVECTGRVIRQKAEKAFYVSPFIGPESTYNFRVLPPSNATSIAIRQEANGRLLMAASFRGVRAPFSSATLLRHLCVFPLMTLKVVAAILFEASKLWVKGFEIFPHAAGGAKAVSSGPS